MSTTHRRLSDTALADAFVKADTGSMFTATLTPLVNKGNVMIHYEWLYSVLCCTPGQGSNFKWNVNKLNDTQVSLSPTSPYQGRTLYASVRPEYNYYVQVQAPFSADWITAVGADEEIGFEPQGLTIACFKGLNNLYINVEPNLTSHDGISGYKIRSYGTAIDDSNKWFMGIQQVKQPHLDLPTVRDLTDADIAAVLNAMGQSCEAEHVTAWRREMC